MKMTTKALLVSLCIAGSTMLAPVVASAGIGIDIDIAPPAPQVEIVPGPRVGYVWAPGYWEWRGGSHVWVGGQWRANGAAIIDSRSVEQRGQHWHHNRGHWER